MFTRRGTLANDEDPGGRRRACSPAISGKVDPHFRHSGTSVFAWGSVNTRIQIRLSRSLLFMLRRGAIRFAHVARQATGGRELTVQEIGTLDLQVVETCRG